MENIGKTRRNGFEVELKWFPSDTLTAFLSYGKVEGRIINPQNSSDKYIENLTEDFIKIGATSYLATEVGKLTTDIFAQRYGTTPLIADNSVTRKAVYSYSAKSSLAINNRFSVFLEGRFVPDKNLSETAY